MLHYDVKIQTVLQFYIIEHTGKGLPHCLNLRLGRTNQNSGSHLSSNTVHESWLQSR